MQNKGEDFLAVYESVNPGQRAKVPVLEIDGVVLTESLVTVEYLAERSGPGPFFLEDPARRASARLMNEVQPFGNYFRFLKVKDDAEKLAEEVRGFEESVANFERFLSVHGDGDGPFLCGSDMCFAEANMAPFVQRIIPTLKHYCDVDVRAICAESPRVARLVDAILDRASVKKTGVPDVDLIANMDKMLARFAT